jgi:hypothetical protein
MSPMTLFILTCSLMLIGCGTATSRRAPDAGKTTQKAIQKIDRICALPQLEREAQLKRLEAETGVVLFCHSDR